MSECRVYSLPVIGILCIDLAQPLQNLYGNEYHSYLVASYVKYLESSGAKVIPIWNNRPKSYYEAIMSKINGILIPGGAIFFNKKYCTPNITNDCFVSSQYIFDIATDLNRKGKHFPLWGTCLGFQLLVKHSIKEVEDIRQDCEHMRISLPVKFESDKVLENSKLFGHLDTQLKEKMSQKPFGYHFHRYCITNEDLRMFKIHNQWTALATNQDENGLEFISIIEHNELPFFGTQFHPERIVFEYSGPNDQCHHCMDCFEISHYFGVFFVQQCRLNDNHFTNYDEEVQHSVHNFPVTYTAAHKLHWEQCFLFKPDVDYPKAEVNVADNGVAELKSQQKI